MCKMQHCSIYVHVLVHVSNHFSSIRSDAWFEVVSVVMEMAIWHSKHATVVAASDKYVCT